MLASPPLKERNLEVCRFACTAFIIKACDILGSWTQRASVAFLYENKIGRWDVLAAYEAATEAHLPTVDCCLAGVEAWHRHARKQAVAVILAAKVSLRILDE